MTRFKPANVTILKKLTFMAAVVCASSAFAAPLAPHVDTFDDVANNQLNLPRQLLTDAVMGGGSSATQSVERGVVTLQGEIVPARGQLGWVSYVLPLDIEGGAQDASPYEGVVLRVKLTKGNLSVSVNSTEVTNFDYHAAPITVTQDGEFHEVKVPFASLKRAWSEQAPLNPKTVNGISIVAYAVQPEPFDVSLDSVSFY
ncbi:CIA30 family protein [Gilvimarinus agarilyticus]|uniref:CIA30 family protein n=1 Tax=Gilvimarinus agarilyticus TaxID=679259 RepID=UPI001E47EA5C|nr:CIA30 family protein [Gilvimarinus agarilyticus]